MSSDMRSVPDLKRKY